MYRYRYRYAFAQPSPGKCAVRIRASTKVERSCLVDTKEELLDFFVTVNFPGHFRVSSSSAFDFKSVRY